ncbi:MAG: dienelactone hydrolase family protein [Legionellales bacterium]|nr:dienelactone hydrolase family protein [Legionellales bacterium]
MKTQLITYYDHQQALHGHLFTVVNPKSTIILFPAFEGPSEFALNYAKHLCEYHFNVFVADIYGKGKTATTLEGCFELVTPFLNDRNLVRQRANLAVEQVAQLHLNTPIDAMGFCFGGMCALEAARSGKNIRRLAGLHSALAKSQLPTHPITSKILIVNGYRDPQVPPENLQAFAQEMQEANNQDWTFVFFGNGKHSYTDPKTGTFNPTKEHEMGREYNRELADQSFRYVIDFFAAE